MEDDSNSMAMKREIHEREENSNTIGVGAMDDGEEWRETCLLGDCIWFILRLAKYLRAD